MSNKRNSIDVTTDYENEHKKLIHNRYVKWIVAASCIIVAVTLFLLPSLPGNKAKLILMPAEISKITIYKEGTAGTTFSYLDAEKINNLTDYLQSLKLQPTTRTPYGPELFYTGEWQIRILGREGSCEVKIVGNELFQHPDGTWWKISQEEAVAFEDLLKSMYPDEPPKSNIFDEWN